MKKMHWKKFIQFGLVLLQVMALFAAPFSVQICAQGPRTVRVAFFPMERFHSYSEEDGYGGMDIAYLEELCSYTGWKTVMNGYEATRAIRSLDRPDAAEIPIAAMTANAFAEDVKAALDAGMNEHIAKPLEPDIIKRVLERWL